VIITCNIDERERCPYATECKGYIGGDACLDGNWTKCATFQATKNIDDCFDKMITAAKHLKKIEEIKDHG